MDDESDSSSSDDERGHREDTESDFEEVISAFVKIALVLPTPVMLKSPNSWTLYKSSVAVF